jgi:hypothetical protein
MQAALLRIQGCFPSGARELQVHTTAGQDRAGGLRTCVASASRLIAAKTRDALR